MVDLKEMSLMLQKGNAPKVIEMTKQALDEKMNPVEILNNGLLSGMAIIGQKFKNNEIFIPEVLIAARAMNEGTKVLEEALLAAGIESVGKAIIGTVKGDLHDIGKNLVMMMLKGAGFEVIDLGTNVPKEKFVEEAIKNDVDVVLVSALLTTTMPYMKEVVDEFESQNVRDKFKIMIGGAPVTQEYCDQIKADIYTKDAATAAEVALSYVQ